MKITLWGVGVSPYTRKAMVALAEKGLEYEQKEILPKVLLQATDQPVPERFDAISPLGKIPAIEIDDEALCDSAIIASYLQQKYYYR